MGSTKVTVYGLSTEGYAIGRLMATNGADVHIIDESTPSAISLTSEIAKSYPTVAALKEDEPILTLEPIDTAIAKSQYLFFAPRIRKAGQDTKTEINSKFKDSVSTLKKNSSVVYNLPTGFGGNNENISLLEHVTGFEAGKAISYYYYPLGKISDDPNVIGSYNKNEDETLAEILSTGKKKKQFTSLAVSEYSHAINTLSHFSKLCSVLEVCKLAQNENTISDFANQEFNDIFLDDMITGLYDLRTLGTSIEGANTMMYMINGGIKGIEGYVKRLIDEIRATLKKNDLKASRTKIAISWSLDQNEMRGDKIDMLQSLTLRLRDYIGDVEAYEGPHFDLFHSDKTTIVVACSKTDLDEIEKNKKNSDPIIVKTNPLCEIIQ